MMMMKANRSIADEDIVGVKEEDQEDNDNDLIESLFEGDKNSKPLIPLRLMKKEKSKGSSEVAVVPKKRPTKKERKLMEV